MILQRKMDTTWRAAGILAVTMLAAGGKALAGSGRGHRVEFTPGTHWKEYRCTWREFGQPEWITGDERVSPLTVDAVEGLSWNLPGDGPFDLELDDVRLIVE